MRHCAKRIGVLFLVLIMLLAAFPLTASAAQPKTVRVTIPDFPVTIGGVSIDSANEEYPFLVYNEITYLPLTYYGCQLLGLYAEWKSPETGLIISDMGAKGAYIPSPRVSTNSGPLTAEVATGKIAIKGVPIDNEAEEWPFLLFRQITYIPMTWANMHDTLGCDYWWDAATGLAIDRAAGEAANVLHLPLGEAFGSTIVKAYNGYFWYYDSDLNVSRTPMTGGASELIYELPKIGQGTFLNPAPNFSVRNGRLYCNYMAGSSPIMSSSPVLRLNADGSVTNLGSYAEVLETADYQIRANKHMVLMNNLQISRDQGQTWESLGDPNFLYALNTAKDSAQSGGASGSTYSASSQYLFEANGLIYTTAHNQAAGDASSPYYEPDAAWPSASRVCSVDPATGETKLLTADYASALQVEGDTIYYLSVPDHVIKACDLDGGNVRQLTPDDVFVAQFTVVNGTLYYTADLEKSTQGNYHEWLWVTQNLPLFVLTADGPKQIGTTPLLSMDANEGYLIARLAADSENPASDPVRLAVYEGESEIYTLRGADVVSAGVSDGNLYFVLR